MKITSDSLVHTVDTDDYRKFQNWYSDETRKHFSSEKKQVEIYTDKIRFHNERNFRKLVFSDKSRNNLENYNVPKNIRIEVLRSLPNRKDIIQLDENTCIKYMKNDNEVFITINYRIPNGNLIGNFYIRVDLIKCSVSTDKSEYLSEFEKVDVTNDEMIERFYGLFMVVVTYLELTPITLYVIEGGKKRGDIVKGNHIKNQTKLTVIQVNTNWNTRVIRTDSFTVRGHWRLQPYGKGLSKYKYIYIDTFEKGLMRRLSQKELVE